MKAISFSNNLRDIKTIGAVTQELVTVQACQKGKDQEGFLKRTIDSYIGTYKFSFAR